jgi:hypothetical protein
MKFRSSSVASILGGTDGLTDAQQRKLDELAAKDKLTMIQLDMFNELTAKKNADPVLTKDTMSAVEKEVDKEVYGYKPDFSSKETKKGLTVESASIEIYNRLFFTDHRKMEETDKYCALETEYFTGHPDIVCEKSKRVIDIKTSWSKATFPKKVKDGRNVSYEWQVKCYLRMMIVITGDDEWRNGEIAYILTTTPEDLKPDWEGDDLHYMDHLDDRLRVTIVPVELTDEDITHMDRRAVAANKYAEEYREYLNNKNA